LGNSASELLGFSFGIAISRFINSAVILENVFSIPEPVFALVSKK